MFFSLADFIISTQYVIHVTYKIYMAQLFMFSVRLPGNSKLWSFGGVKNYTFIFNCMGVVPPAPVLFKGQLTLGKLEPSNTLIDEALKANPVTQITDEITAWYMWWQRHTDANQGQRDGPHLKARGRLPRGRDNWLKNWAWVKGIPVKATRRCKGTGV